MKKWQTMFEIRRVETNRPTDDGLYQRVSFGVFIKGTDERPNKRWYSYEKDAERGAAQIFNKIEKTLLGDE